MLGAGRKSRADPDGRGSSALIKWPGGRPYFFGLKWGKNALGPIISLEGLPATTQSCYHSPIVTPWPLITVFVVIKKGSKEIDRHARYAIGIAIRRIVCL